MVTLQYDRYLKLTKPHEDLGNEGDAIITQQIDIDDQANNGIVTVDVEQVIHNARDC